MKQRVAIILEVSDLTRIRLIYCGRVLQDDNTIEIYSIIENSVVHAVVRPENIPPSPAPAPASSTSSTIPNQFRRATLMRLNPNNSTQVMGTAVSIDANASDLQGSGLATMLNDLLRSQGLGALLSDNDVGENDNTTALGTVCHPEVSLLLF